MDQEKLAFIKKGFTLPGKPSAAGCAATEIIKVKQIKNEERQHRAGRRRSRFI